MPVDSIRYDELRDPGRGVFLRDGTAVTGLFARRLALACTVAIAIADMVLVGVAVQGSALSSSSKPRSASVSSGNFSAARTQLLYPAPEMVNPTRAGASTRSASPRTADAGLPGFPDPGAPPPIPDRGVAPAPEVSAAPSPQARVAITSVPGDPSIEVLGESRTVVDPEVVEPTESLGTIRFPIPVADSAGARLLLDVDSGGGMILALRGVCPAADHANVAVSHDLGRSWAASAIPAAQLLRVEARADGGFGFVATDHSCRPFARVSAGSGSMWTPAEIGGTWYLSPDSYASQIVVPGLLAESGCVPVSLAVVDAANAAVACRDGAVRTTADGGDSWAAVANLPGVTSIALTSPTRGVALTVTAECDSSVMRTANGGASWHVLTCLDRYLLRAATAATASTARHVPVDSAIAASGEVIAVAVAGGADADGAAVMDSVVVSTDGGVHWFAAH